MFQTGMFYNTVSYLSQHLKNNGSSYPSLYVFGSEESTVLIDGDFIMQTWEKHYLGVHIDQNMIIR